MNKKKLIIAILVTMMILVGCGNNQEDNQSSIPAREVENCDMMITIIEQGETTDIYGKYTGPVVAGKPHGEGTFWRRMTISSMNTMGILWKDVTMDMVHLLLR